MSNPTLFLAPPHCPSSTAVEEPSNHAPFQDIVENQNLPGVSSPKGLDSNTEVQHPPTQPKTKMTQVIKTTTKKQICLQPPDDQQETKAQASKRPLRYTKRQSKPHNANSQSSKLKNTFLSPTKICTPQILGPDIGNCACGSKRSF